MQIYLAGKISGLPLGEVRTKFEAAATMLRKEYRANVTHGLIINRCLHCRTSIDGEGFNCERCDNTGVRQQAWQKHMQNDIVEMMQCDMVVMLPDWMDSPGATIEHDLALSLGMKVLYLPGDMVSDTILSIPLNFKYSLSEIRRAVVMCGISDVSDDNLARLFVRRKRLSCNLRELAPNESFHMCVVIVGLMIGMVALEDKDEKLISQVTENNMIDGFKMERGGSV